MTAHPSAPLRVSIVVPVYNGARYLAEALDSLLAQRYPALDVVVVDDGSTDKTPEILAAYSGRVRVLRQANKGQSAAMNLGWAHASGDVLSYLSADDRLRPDAVATAVDALCRYPEALAVYGDYGLMGPDSQALSVVQAPDFDHRDVVSTATCPPGPGVFIRRTAHVAAGPWSETLRQMPDLDYWLRLGLLGPIVHVPEVLADFREHEASATFRAPSEARAEEAVVVYAGFFSRGDLPPEVQALRRRSMAHAHLLTARAHLRAGRISRALAHLWRTALLSPSTIASVRAWRLLGSGLFGAWRHRRRWRAGWSPGGRLPERT